MTFKYVETDFQYPSVYSFSTGLMLPLFVCIIELLYLMPDGASFLWVGNLIIALTFLSVDVAVTFSFPEILMHTSAAVNDNASYL